MAHFPHTYAARARAVPTGDVSVDSDELPPLSTSAPAQFGGPGNLWSPETLLVAAVADCFILTFRAIARASRLDWLELDCDVEGRLDRHDRITQFTHFEIRASLRVPEGTEDIKDGWGKRLASF